MKKKTKTAAKTQSAKAPSEKPKPKRASKSKAKSAAASSLPKAEQMERDVRRLHEIEDLETTAKKSEAEYLASKEKTKSLKKKWESDVDTLRTRIRSRDELLPFAPQPAQQAKQIESKVIETKSSEDDLSAKDKAAFDVATLSDIGIVGKTAEKLDADGVRCGADLQKWIGGHPRRKIAGVGDGAIEKITEAMAKWYEERTKKRSTNIAAAKSSAQTPSETKTVISRKELRAAIEQALKAAGIANEKPHRMKLVAKIAEIDEDKIERFAETATGETLAKWLDALTAMKADEIKNLFAEKSDEREAEPESSQAEAATAA